MFRIINEMSEKTLLESNNVNKFISYTQMIFDENEDFLSMQKPTSSLGCKNYIETYCDNLILIIK